MWGSKKQSVVARSVGEAEYRAIALGVTELMWLKSLFLELGYPCTATPIVWSDNLAAKSMAENPIFHSRTKHVEIDVHFVHEKVEMVKWKLDMFQQQIKWLMFSLKDCLETDSYICVKNLD